MFVVIAVIIAVCAFVLWDTKKPTNYPPGPKWLPVIGNFHQYGERLKVLGYHHLVWQKLSEHYGPVVGLRMGRVRVVTVSSADLVREVLTRDEFDGRPDGFFFRFRTFGKRLGLL